MTLAAQSEPENYEAQLLAVVREHAGESLSIDELLDLAKYRIDTTDLRLRQSLWHLILEDQLRLTSSREIELPTISENN